MIRVIKACLTNGLRLELGERQHSMVHAKGAFEVVEIVLSDAIQKKSALTSGRDP